MIRITAVVEAVLVVVVVVEEEEVVEAGEGFYFFGPVEHPLDVMLPSYVQLVIPKHVYDLFVFSFNLMGRVGEKLFHNKLRIVAGFLTGCFHPLRLGAWRAAMPLPFPALPAQRHVLSIQPTL